MVLTHTLYSACEVDRRSKSALKTELLTFASRSSEAKQIFQKNEPSAKYTVFQEHNDTTRSATRCVFRKLFRPNGTKPKLEMGHPGELSVQEFSNFQILIEINIIP